MFEISAGAHLCAINSRLKAAPAITLSEREMLGFSRGRTKPRDGTVVLGVNGRIIQISRLP